MPDDQQQKRDLAVVGAMSLYDLKPGQMLIFGPKSVASVSGKAKFGGVLEDKYVFERTDWDPYLTKKRRP